MRQLGPALRRQIRRKRNLELPRDRGVAPALGLLGSVPEQMPIPRPLGGVVGHDQGRRFDAALPTVVVDLARPLIRDPRARTIGGRRSRGATGGAADRFDGQMEDSHGCHRGVGA